ncbi:MAG TPA: DUF362 domain-containing protein [Bacteroidota bacterium]|nr:DUF362 domain-containing protein [Bacteroidota bacterium]
MKAIDALGGMQRFVKKGNTVALLINATFDGRAASTNPDIPLAVMKMCQDAGAREIWLLKQTGSAYWRRSSQYPRLKADVDTMRYEDEFKEVKIDQGKSLKSAEVAARLLSCDVFINLPIIKDHEGTRFTGNLKNMMGACSSSTCRRFHFGDSSVLNVFKGYYSNPELLAQSIADVNLIRRPNLCVVDATEILATNGPAGPGEVRKPREVIVSTSCVAADMYASRHLGLDWQELLVIRDAIDHGYGPKSLKEVSIRTL